MGRTTEKLEERQQGKTHGHQQQGHLDNASRHLLFNSRVRQQQILQMLDRKIIQIVVGASNDPLQHRNDQLFERP